MNWLLEACCYSVSMLLWIGSDCWTARIRKYGGSMKRMRTCAVHMLRSEKTVSPFTQVVSRGEWMGWTVKAQIIRHVWALRPGRSPLGSSPERENVTPEFGTWSVAAALQHLWMKYMVSSSSSTAAPQLNSEMEKKAVVKGEKKWIVSLQPIWTQKLKKFVRKIC